MAIAFVLITTEPSFESKVYKEITKHPNVEYASPLFGEYDILAKLIIDEQHPYEHAKSVEKDSKDDFQSRLGYLVVEGIRSIKGVNDTKTLTALTV